MIRAAPGLTGRAERRQHLSVWAELDDDLSALVAFRGSVLGDRIGDPDVAVAVDVEPVRPDEHAAAEALHHFAVGTELEDRIGLGIAAFVAEPRGILQAIASHDRPDVAAVGIDRYLADRSH